MSPDTAANDASALPEPWREDSYTKHGFVELLPVAFLMRFRGNVLGKTDIVKLTEYIGANGIPEPLILMIGQADRKVKLGEGNHRLESAVRLNETHVPVRVMRYTSIPEGGVVFDHMARVPVSGYFRADAAPSMVFDEGVIDRFARLWAPEFGLSSTRYNTHSEPVRAVGMRI